jgi:3-deoxy-manno-octulosonate cytidylyltransferase (CMP-KDO synthetase)
MNYKIVIPSRMASSRFPGKPLALINKKPMLHYVIDQCLKAVSREKLLVATDSNEIGALCDELKTDWMLTSDHVNGTSRIAEVNSKLECDFIINVQGDEPLFNPEDIKTVLATMMKNEISVLTGYTSLDSESEWRDPNTIKLVKNEANKVIYLSRAPIPGGKTNEFISGLRQVCIYAYTKNALDLYSKQPRSKLELMEDHELLRFYDLGLEIQGVLLSNSSIPVDIVTDIKLVEAAIGRNQNK